MFSISFHDLKLFCRLDWICTWQKMAVSVPALRYKCVYVCVCLCVMCVCQCFSPLVFKSPIRDEQMYFYEGSMESSGQGTCRHGSWWYLQCGQSYGSMDHAAGRIFFWLNIAQIKWLAYGHFLTYMSNITYGLFILT